MQLSRLPMAFEWQVAPADWTVGLDGTLHIVAGPSTDLFLDPAGGPARLGAPRLMTAVDGDFQLSAYVKADLRATFDAGALVLHAGDHSWVKLALERSPQGQAMVVSVVTRGLSDDANGRVVIAEGARLERSTVRGPAVIGARAHLVDAYVGPYSAIGEDCVIEHAEVEHSILLAGSSVRHLDGRMEASLLGRNVHIARSDGQPRAYRFMVGDNSEIGIL